MLFEICEHEYELAKIQIALVEERSPTQVPLDHEPCRDLSAHSTRLRNNQNWASIYRFQAN